MWHTVSLKEYPQFSGVCLDILQYLTEGPVFLIMQAAVGTAMSVCHQSATVIQSEINLCSDIHAPRRRILMPLVIL